MIASRWPKASQKIAELSDFANVENILKEAYLDRLLRELDVGLGIKLDDLASFKRPIRNELIRYWVKKNGYAVPNKKNIDEINKTFIDSQPSKKSTVKWSKSDNSEKQKIDISQIFQMFRFPMWFIVKNTGEII